MNELALFAGAGGGILAGKLLGWRTICAVEVDRHARHVLMDRQNDGILEPFPIWDDVTTFDGRPWRGLWFHMARIIGEVEPRRVFVENVAQLRRDGLGVVLHDIARLGYDARWGVVRASNAGAYHHRARLWLVADSNSVGCSSGHRETGGAAQTRKEERERLLHVHRRDRFEAPSQFEGSAHGLANQLDRNKAIGNGQVPAVAALAWRILTDGC